MQFESQIEVARDLQDVARFFDDPLNIARWDKSVARVIPTSTGPTGVGSTFDTIAPSGMRMSYRIIEHEPDHGAAELMESRIFRQAVWRMQLTPVPGGTRVICRLEFRLRPRYLLLIVPLLLTQRRALQSDLVSLKQVLEGGD
jgi:hypothetical protein